MHLAAPSRNAYHYVPGVGSKDAGVLAARGSVQPARLLVIEAAYSEFVAYLRILAKGCRCDNDPLTSHCRLGYHTSQPVTGLFSSSSSLHRTLASSPDTADKLCMQSSPFRGYSHSHSHSHTHTSRALGSTATSPNQSI